MHLSNELKQLYIETASKLSGKDRRKFMAQVVLSLGNGGQRLAEREFGWNRGTIRRGTDELFEVKKKRKDGGKVGRKSILQRLPNLDTHIHDVMARLNPKDPIYIATEYFTGVTVSTVRRCLVDWYEYDDEVLPSNETLRRRLRDLGYHYRAS